MIDNEKVNTSLRQLILLHTAMFLGQFFFLGVMFFIKSGEVREDKFYTFLVPVLVIIGFVGGHFIYKTLLSRIPASASLDQRLSSYRSASIAKWAFLEGSTLFTIIAYMMTGRMIFVAYVLLLLGVFVINRPTKDKLETELGLTGL